MLLPTLVLSTVQAAIGIPTIVIARVPLAKAVTATIATTAVTAAIAWVGYQLCKDCSIDTNGNFERSTTNE